MKHVVSTNRAQSGVDLVMTPMIDVVFLLLVFFLWTASFQVIEYMLPTELSLPAGQAPRQQTPDPSWDFEPVVIQLLWLKEEPVYLVNETRVESLVNIEQTLAAIAKINPDNPVIIDPDPDVPFGFVVDVYDSSRLAGFNQVQFAASEDV